MLLLWIGGLSAAVGAAENASSVAPAPGQIASWDFIQSVGGIQIAQASQKMGTTWKLPLACDLSGQQTFTQKPTLVNSGMVIEKTLAEQDRSEIFISLVVAHPLWTLDPNKAQCKTIVIESKPGVYQISYRDGAGKTFPIGIAEFKLN